ncbi:MAG: serine/threonine protein phosphatase PrpC [Candidatus Pseudothioglobus sp.]|jgi:protein phosphatase
MSLRGKLEIVSQTDVGQVRDHNEDFVRFDDTAGVAVLADGMGGMNAGEVASSMTVLLLMDLLVAFGCGGEALVNELAARDVRVLDLKAQELAALENARPLPVRVVQHAIEKANQSVFHVSQTQPQCQGMGTTVVVGLFYDNKMVVGHLGDSRVYRYRDQRLEQVTQDHSLVQELLDKGLVTPAEARVSNKKNVVTRALGVAHKVEVEVHEHKTLPGDIYLLCSDGLTDLVTDEDIEASLQELGGNLGLATGHLVNLANASGGKDNISIILVRVRKPYPAKAGMIEKIVSWFE